jgi:hypothetical protein
VAVIFEDEVNGNTFYLTVFDGNEIRENDTLKKINFIRNSELKEREYIEKVFKENFNQKYFVSQNGIYSLFVPYQNDKIKIIFLFSNRRNYGTLSS